MELFNNDTTTNNRKRIALVAHDKMKKDLIDWAIFNREVLNEHELFATGTTGILLEEQLSVPVNKLKSGPLGGDQQIGSRISEELIDFLIFFWDPMAQHPHEHDVKALLRIAVLWNIPVACNRASADFLISSDLIKSGYQRMNPNYERYERRALE